MFARVRAGCRRAGIALVLASGIGIFSGSSVLAHDGEPTGAGVSGTPLAVTGIPVAKQNSPANWLGLWGPFRPGQHGHGGSTGALRMWWWEQSVAWRNHGHGGLGKGTLGWADPGLYPGFYGFGLSFHPGYGYGGYGLGVGGTGGDPFYGGPGYPCGGQLYDGGPAYTGQPAALIRPDYPYGGPTTPAEANTGMAPEDANRGDSLLGPGTPYFGYNSGEGRHMPPPLGDYHGYLGGFGPFTGASSYPFTHPSYTAAAAAAGSVFDPFSNAGASEGIPGPGGGPAGPVIGPATGIGPPLPSTTTPSPAPPGGMGAPAANVAPTPGGIIPPPRTAPDLGIDEQPVVDPDVVQGIRVARVDPETAAARAGLQPGDVILSSNGYLTEQPGNLAWIIAQAAPGKVLQMKVRKAGDGREQIITVPLSIEPVDTARPPYLPPVSPGPPPATR